MAGRNSQANVAFCKKEKNGNRTRARFPSIAPTGIDEVIRSKICGDSENFPTSLPTIFDDTSLDLFGHWCRACRVDSTARRLTVAGIGFLPIAVDDWACTVDKGSRPFGSTVEYCGFLRGWSFDNPFDLFPAKFSSRFLKNLKWKFLADVSPDFGHLVTALIRTDAGGKLQSSQEAAGINA